MYFKRGVYVVDDLTVGLDDIIRVLTVEEVDCSALLAPYIIENMWSS